jgi:hypothetical protein
MNFMRFDLCDHCITKDNIKSNNKSRGQSVLKSLFRYEIMVNGFQQKRNVSKFKNDVKFLGIERR